MSEILDGLPEILDLVHRDIVDAGGKPNVGRDGMTAEQVLRAMLIKQQYDLSYEDLAFHLADSFSFRAFCRIGSGMKAPVDTTLQRNIKCIRAETWESISRLLVQHGQKKKIETGKMTRTDCTVVETNIHKPTDSSLLWDSVRVLARLMTEAQEAFGVTFVDHSRRAKKRALGILNAKNEQERVPLYRDLVKVTELTRAQAARVAEQILSGAGSALVACLLHAEFLNYLKLSAQVVDQTTRRVLNKESVPVAEKIVSIFEPHTDIIIKNRRETLFGHKICLTTGTSGLVLDCVVEDGNPADSTLAHRMIKQVTSLFGKAPRQVTFDGGFSSKDNVEQIKKLGVNDVAFSKHVGLTVTEMVKSEWVMKKLRNFRAGVEGGISFLKRCFGLDRCTWRTLDGFKSYVHASVVACNLLVLARRLLVTEPATE
jgi:IS5 family transposase